jgi:hypothetical protein
MIAIDRHLKPDAEVDQRVQKLSCFSRLWREKHLEIRRINSFFSRGVYPERSEGLLQNDKWLLLG